MFHDYILENIKLAISDLLARVDECEFRLSPDVETFTLEQYTGFVVGILSASPEDWTDWEVWEDCECIPEITGFYGGVFRNDASAGTEVLHEYETQSYRDCVTLVLDELETRQTEFDLHNIDIDKGW